MPAAPPPPTADLIWCSELQCSHEPCIRLRSLVNAASHPWCISASSPSYHCYSYLFHTTAAQLKGLLLSQHSESSCSACISACNRKLKPAWLLQMCMVYIAVAGRCTPCVALCIKVHESNALDDWTGRTPVETCKAVDLFLWKKRKRGARKIFTRSIQGWPTPDRIQPSIALLVWTCFADKPYFCSQRTDVSVAQVFSSYDPVLAGTFACTSSFVQ